MTSAAAGNPQAVGPPSPPTSISSGLEFLVVGGATLLLFPLLWLFRVLAGLDAAELTVGFLAFYGATVINDPHFAVTYLLFYRRMKARAFGSEFTGVQRLRYLAAGFLVPLGMAIWIGVAIASGSGRTLGWLVQLMFFLVGWHYVKQGFGVLAVLSARRGISIPGLTRRAVLVHAFSGWAYAWASPADPGRELIEKGVVFSTVAHPSWLEGLTQTVFLLTAAGLVVALVADARRVGRFPPPGPLLGFLVSVWLWTVYSSLDPLMVYLIPALHSVQYLYFVWLIRGNEARKFEGPPHFAGPVSVRLGVLAASAIALGWLALNGLPRFLDGVVFPRADAVEVVGGLGPTPYFAACFAFVNIHHYFMDHVIWRRENPETRFLRG